MPDPQNIQPQQAWADFQIVQQQMEALQKKYKEPQSKKEATNNKLFQMLGLEHPRYTVSGDFDLVHKEKFGIEVELEEVVISKKKKEFNYWTTTEDGSLRNNGLEFISKILASKDVPKAVEELQQALDSFNPSARCGVHVHVSLESFTINEIKKFILWYFVAESIIFKYTGNRADNCFCIPWKSQDLIKLHKIFESNNMETFIARGCGGSHMSKYDALNLLPLQTLGTVEFRQHEAVKDFSTIINFTHLLHNIYKLAESESLFQDDLLYVKNINTASNYSEVVEKLLRNTGYIFDSFDVELHSLIRKQVFKLKLSLG